MFMIRKENIRKYVVSKKNVLGMSGENYSNEKNYTKLKKKRELGLLD